MHKNRVYDMLWCPCYAHIETTPPGDLFQFVAMFVFVHQCPYFHSYELCVCVCVRGLYPTFTSHIHWRGFMLIPQTKSGLLNLRRGRACCRSGLVGRHTENIAEIIVFKKWNNTPCRLPIQFRTCFCVNKECIWRSGMRRTTGDS